MTDSNTLLALRARIRELRSQRAGIVDDASRTYVITDRKFNPRPPWPPTPGELALSGQAVTRHCAEGHGDLADAEPLCPHEIEAVNEHRAAGDRADLGHEHHKETR